MKKEDFIKSFSMLSNVELLKIVGQQEYYQAEAIEVAKEILSGRNYDQEEVVIAQREINSLLINQQRRNEKLEKVKILINDFIDENFGIDQKTSKKLLNLLCAGLFFYTFISCILNIRSLTRYSHSNIQGWFFAIFIYLLQFLFIYLLFKRNNWGWVLITGSAIILSLQSIESFISYYTDRNEFFFIRIDPYTALLSFVLNTSIIIFLNAKRIREQFVVTKEGRTITMIVSVVLFGLYTFVLKYV